MQIINLTKQNKRTSTKRLARMCLYIYIYIYIFWYSVKVWYTENESTENVNHDHFRHKGPVEGKVSFYLF